MDNNHFLQFAINTAKEAGSILMKYFGKIDSIKTKSNEIDLLTIADTKSDKYIIDQIKSSFPNHNIISEESNITQSDSDYRWVIDPLDGTTNFVHNLPIFAVSIALQYKKNTIVGVVFNPAANKCFWAKKNGGSFLNDNSIHTSSTNILSKSLLVTGFPYTHDYKWDKGFDIFKEIYGRTQGVRRLGSAALDLCFVAMGRFEGFWEFGLQPWDICAGNLILKEAGGNVTDWDDSPSPFSGSRILATNDIIHNELVQILEKRIDLFLD